jgi:hypothetical protein
VVEEEVKSPDTAPYHNDEGSSQESPNKIDQLVDVGAAMIMCDESIDVLSQP